MLGLSLSTLKRTLKRPGAPKARPNGNWNVDEVRAFHVPGNSRTVIGEGGEKPATQEGEEEPPAQSRREALLCQTIEEKLEFERWERECAKGLWKKKSEVRDDIVKCNAKVRQELERRLSQVAPQQYAQVNGDPAECARINKKHLSESFKFFATEGMFADGNG
jgi:hypothetical protein